mmetsp:Transcript_23336/g.34447  ORF Transcript_23336/g.34447 Transcript_23336/m.34447 type:complete len:680 (+) Transcript_23336:89-2128(+)
MRIAWTAMSWFSFNMVTAKSNEPLKPEWPINVMVFKPTDDAEDIKARIKPTEDPLQEYELNGEKKLTHNTEHHFDTKHYALLFEPGEYKDCSFEVGYYVQMAGLGKDAEGSNAARFTGAKSGPYVEALNKHMSGGSNQAVGTGLCLDTFWRSAENFSSENTQWAVSQAAPLRRVNVANELVFGDGDAYSSGGFVANSKVGGHCDYAANQQWFSRACDFKQTSGGAWSTVFAGCTGDIPQNDSSPSDNNAHVRTVEEAPEVRVEKPYVAIDTHGNYNLHVPKATRDATTGAQLDSSNDEIRPFSNVKVGKPILPMKDGEYVNHNMATYNDLIAEDEKITNDLQQALDEGKDLVLCPGIFFLTKPLVITHANQVILGLGLATLIAPQDGSPCISVKAKTAGVRIAGLMLEASKQQPESGGRASDGKSCLLSFGELDVADDAGDADNPGLISDVFTRVGGSNLDRAVSTDIMVRVHSGNVVGDNLWLWRADHVKLREGEEPNDPELPLYWQTRMWKEEDGKKIRIDECITKNALEVTGDDVKMYGLFCEHTTEHQLVWKGERGSTTFFQCELPYDVDIDFANDNFTGYYVDENVEEHTARAIGVYSNFQVYDVDATTGMQLPSKEGIILHNPFSLFLNNKGSIQKTLNQGGALVGKKPADIDTKGIPQRAWVGEKRATIEIV